MFNRSLQKARWPASPKYKMYVRKYQRKPNDGLNVGKNNSMPQGQNIMDG